MSRYSLVNANGQMHPIEGDTTFGRGAQCTYRLADQEVSRLHATVFMQGDKLVVRDENSANGTFVNGQRSDVPTLLGPGDVVRFGSTVLTVQAEVPVAGPLAPRAPAGVPQGRTSAMALPGAEEPSQRSPLLGIAAGCALLLVCLGIGGAAALFLPQLGLQDRVAGLLGQETYSLEEALADEAVDDRQELQAYLGLPDAFTITQVVVDGVPLRLETWRYYGFGTRVDFVDGEIAWTIDIDPVPEDTLFAAWYDPLDFELGMSPAQAAEVAASASPAGQAPEFMDLSEGGDELAGATMLVGDQIMIGLDPQGVVYVETMALFPAEEGG